MVTKVTETKYCDICGEVAVICLDFIIDRRCDAAGSMEDVWYAVDLCALHRHEVSVRARQFVDPPSAWVSISHFCRSRHSDRHDRRQLSDHIKMLKSIWKTMDMEDRKLARMIVMRQ